ncbi:MAG: hypothetical protein PHH40_03650 [Candidatus Moranbacteria bacterium]|nr:hypothetical protein [Candidatus Moranbacteria bacterium]MDD3964657.1 hypothetical protein [Candidatus Moranbacteria bacterium]
MSFLDAKNQTPAVRTMQSDLDALKNHINISSPIAQEHNSVPVPITPASTSAPLPSQQSRPKNPFQQDIAKITETIPVTANTEQFVNPFAVAPKPQSGIPPKQAQETQIGRVSNTSDTNIELDAPKGKKVLWIAIIVLLVLLACGGIAYYFIVVRATSSVSATQTSEEKVVPAVVEETVPLVSPYALNTANYLPLNIETVSVEDIRNTLRSVSTRISEASIEQPVEFLITDQNNNKLAFSRFALLLKLEMNPELLSNIDESFSLYMYNDAGKVRIGLDLLLKNQTAVVSLLSKSENTLPYALRMLLLGPNITVSQSTSFKSNVYTSRVSMNTAPIAIRYANVDTEKNISLDYAITKNHWYIGTSKNTLTAILDKNVK